MANTINAHQSREFRVKELVELIYTKGYSRSELKEYYEKQYGLKPSTLNRDIVDAKVHFEVLQAQALKKTEEFYMKEHHKALKKGIKTKNERVMLLQKQIDECLEWLEKGETYDERVKEKDGKATQKIRKMSAWEIVNIRKLIKDLVKEIALIQGDYAPVKIKAEVEEVKPETFKIGDKVITFGAPQKQIDAKDAEFE